MQVWWFIQQYSEDLRHWSHNPYLQSLSTTPSLGNIEVTDPYLQSLPWMTKIFLELNRRCQFVEDLVSYLNLCLNHLYLCTIKYVQFKSNLTKGRHLFTLSHRGSDSSQLLIVFSELCVNFVFAYCVMISTNQIMCFKWSAVFWVT